MGIQAIQTAEEAWGLRNTDQTAARSAGEALLAQADAGPRTIALAKTVLCYLDYRERRYAQAAAAGLEALAVLEADPRDPWLPRLYNALAIIHFDLGERDTSRAYLDRQIRLSRALGDHTYEALGCHDLGLLQAAVDRPRGLATLAEARTQFQASGDVEHEALALYNMANICLHAGEHALASGYAGVARQLLRASPAQGLRLSLSVHLATLLAEVASADGRHSEAQTLLDEARELVARRAPALLPHVHYCQGLHLAATGDDPAALAQFQAALAQLDASGSYELLADCHAALSDCHERLGDYRAALAHQRAYAALRERSFAEASEQKVRALDVIHQVETARQAAEAERQRSAELQQAIEELEQLQAALRAQNLRDPLTGLFNRRYLAEEGERLLHAAQRYRSELCAAIIDVDRFKQINDALGHPVGDLVLQRLGEIFSQTLRSTDLIVRYGGEEIVLLLPSTSIDEALDACERLRTRVVQHGWADLHPDLRVTVSIGLVAGGGHTLDELLARADAQLYAAKRAGRNRTSYTRDGASGAIRG